MRLFAIYDSKIYLILRELQVKVPVFIEVYHIPHLVVLSIQKTLDTLKSRKK